MKNLYALSALIVLFASNIFAQPTPPTGKLWEEVADLTDEFDTWDDSKWFKSLWNYGVPVQMKAENSGVADGKLWIKATLDEDAERWFETSRVMSKTQINYPMYTECKIITAHISAYNTFWLNNGNSENRNEIDVIENNSKPSCGCQPDFPWQMNSQYFHVVDNDIKRNKGNFDNRNLSDTNSLKGIAWNEAYHTVGVWWKDARHIQFYLDGEAAGSVVSERDFTRELNIIWDLWTIDEDWSGGIAAKNDLLDEDINTMYVDWIHTYSLVDDPDYTSGLNSTTTGSVKIFPSKVTDNLNISIAKDISPNASLEIYDSIGSLMYAKNNIGTYEEVSLSNFKTGIYLVKIHGNNLVFSQSVFKE